MQCTHNNKFDADKQNWIEKGQHGGITNVAFAAKKKRRLYSPLVLNIGKDTVVLVFSIRIPRTARQNHARLLFKVEGDPTPVPCTFRKWNLLHFYKRCQNFYNSGGNFYRGRRHDVTLFFSTLFSRVSSQKKRLCV